MASIRFTYSPTSGNGNTSVNVTPSGQNASTSNYTATITFSNGSASKTVNLTQLYVPYFNQGQTTIPASGGSIYITAHTEYDIVFRQVPSWITITGNGLLIREGQRVMSSMADGTVFTLTASPNTGSSRSVSNTFNIGHYIGDTIQQQVAYITISQDGSSAPTVEDGTIDVTAGVEYMEEGSLQFDLDIYSHNAYSDSTNFTLTNRITEGSDTLNIKYLSDGSTTITFKIMLWYTDEHGTGMAKEFGMTLDYGTQSTVDTIVTGNEGIYDFDYEEDATAYITLEMYE